MNDSDQPPKCCVDGCGKDAILISPVPVCGLDALQVITQYREQQTSPGGRLSRVEALAEIEARPLFNNVELAARTGWPIDWIKAHRAQFEGG